MFVRPKLPPPTRVTRSSSQRTKKTKAAVENGSPEEAEQSASDTTSDFEELGTDDISSPQTTTSVEGQE